MFVMMHLVHDGCIMSWMSSFICWPEFLIKLFIGNALSIHTVWVVLCLSVCVLVNYSVSPRLVTITHVSTHYTCNNFTHYVLLIVIVILCNRAKETIAAISDYWTIIVHSTWQKTQQIRNNTSTEVTECIILTT